MVVVASVGACGSPTEEQDPRGHAAETGSPSAAVGGLSRYSDIPALRDELVASGLACDLEYEGLEDPDRIVSICVIDDEEALLTIWKDPAMLGEFLDSGSAPPTMAYGTNWSVELDSTQVAESVAEALDGATPQSG